MSFVVELEDFRPEGDVYIYGSDTSGRSLRLALAAKGIGCRGFIDSFQSGEADGVPVLRFDRYLQIRDRDDIILIASAAEGVISRDLEAQGIARYFVALRLEI